MTLSRRVAVLLLPAFVFLAFQPQVAQSQKIASFEKDAPFAENSFSEESAGVDHATRSVVLKPIREEVSSQGLAVLPRRTHSSRPDSSSYNIGAPIALGIVGGAVGFFAGGLSGGGIETAAGCESEFLCGLEGAAYGGIIGQAAGLSLGVHLGNGGQGNYWLTLLGATGTSLAGMLVAGAFEEPSVLLGVPVAQFAVTIPIAHSTSR